MHQVAQDQLAPCRRRARRSVSSNWKHLMRGAPYPSVDSNPQRAGPITPSLSRSPPCPPPPPWRRSTLVAPVLGRVRGRSRPGQHRPATSGPSQVVTGLLLQGSKIRTGLRRQFFNSTSLTQRPANILPGTCGEGFGVHGGDHMGLARPPRWEPSQEEAVMGLPGVRGGRRPSTPRECGRWSEPWPRPPGHGER